MVWQRSLRELYDAGRQTHDVLLRRLPHRDHSCEGDRYSSFLFSRLVSEYKEAPAAVLRGLCVLTLVPHDHRAKGQNEVRRGCWRIARQMLFLISRSPP